MKRNTVAWLLLVAFMVLSPLAVVFGTVIADRETVIHKELLDNPEVPDTVAINYKMNWYVWVLVGFVFGLVAIACGISCLWLMQKT